MKFILAGFVMFLSYEAFSQPLEMHKSFGGAHFKRDTIYLSEKQVRDILTADPQASHEFKLGMRNSRLGALFGFSGAILLAMPIITTISGGHPNRILAGGGAVLLGVSIPLSKGSKRHFEAAIDGYNQRQVQQSRTKFYFTGNGLTLKF
jgi:hypothetical protein